MTTYIHGYTEREVQRLREQCHILEELIHGGISFLPGSKVLEPGCGVGAQTAILARRNPGTAFTSIDISAASLSRAQEYIKQKGVGIVTFLQADLLELPFPDGEFDQVFLCFVLEHVADPNQALSQIKRVLKPGGRLTIIEGDHGSCFWHPQTQESVLTWRAMVKAQQEIGHDPLIGRRLHPLLQSAGFQVQEVVPRWVYADAGVPELRDGVLNQIIVPMTQSAREEALSKDFLTRDTWEQGLSDLESISQSPEGTFFYTWFRGIAVKR